MIPNMEKGPPSTVFGKVFALVFLAGFTIIAIMMANSARSRGGEMGFSLPGVDGTVRPSGPGGVFVVVPTFMAIIGAMLFIGVLVSPLKKAPRPPEAPEFDPRSDRYGDLEERPRPPVVRPPDPPAVVQPALACPGCGTRKNAPGTSNCEYCGSAIKTVR